MSGHSRSKLLQERAARVLAPAVYGTTLSRSGNPLMPKGTPHFFSHAKGARVWDVDGKEYIDLLCAMGPNILGYGDARIEAAAQRQRELGDTMIGPSPIMVDLAEKLVATVSHADWALFAKNGVDVISVALRIARAQTGKRRVLVATGSYHGAHPWCTPYLVGVLPEERAHRSEYRYNDVASLEAAVAEAGDDLAAIYASAYKHDFSASQEALQPEYARRCRELCDQTGALLVVDDIRAGFRLARDCSWELVGVRPDLSCWSKAIANGYPLSALLGSERVREGAGKPLITGTFWIQAVPMAASLATLEVITTTDYLEHTIGLGELLRSGMDTVARTHNFELSQTGPVQMPMIHFKDDPGFRFATSFASQMMQRGIYMYPQHNLFLCAAMTQNDIEQILDAADHSFAQVAIERSQIEAAAAMPDPLVDAPAQTRQQA